MAAKNQQLATEAFSHMKATADEAELHRRQRALAEVARLFFMISVQMMDAKLIPNAAALMIFFHRETRRLHNWTWQGWKKR